MASENKLKLICDYCGAEFPHFKALLDHYQEKHQGELKRYEISLHKRVQTALIYATGEDEALEITGWNREDCKIKRIE